MSKTIGKYLFLMFLSALLTLFVAICHKANNTENVIYFTGQSDNWQAVIVYTYQESWSIDKNNTWHYHSVEQERGLLRYKNADYKDIGRLKWKCTSIPGESSGTLDKPGPGRFGFISLGYGSSTGALMRAGDYYTMTVEWDGGKKETFKLVASEK